VKKLWSVRGVRSIGVILFALCAATGAEAMFVEVASGDASPPILDVSPGGNLSDGQTITVAVGANGYFTPHAGVKILECADPGGTQGNLPKDDSTCDGNTIQGISILIGSDGRFSDTTYQVYMLPSQTLGEQSNFKPICNQTNDCVLYVGQNQNDFTAPKVFSAPFLISPGSGAANATTTTEAASSGSSGATATTSASGTSGTTAKSSASSPDATAALTGATSLANTGAPADIVWVVAFGTTLLLTGAIGRRRAVRSQR
jgi:hypothetical protein